MAYKITPNFFAIKYWDRELNYPIQLHSISYKLCNFRCGFCNFNNRHCEEYIDYTQEEFRIKAQQLISLGSYFKFTGGEPTINPYLIQDLLTIRSLNGHAFLDSNGSNPKIIEKILKENLIDVLGISIKGLSKEEAVATASISNSYLCWERVFETLAIADKYKVKTIVTMVFHKGVPLGGLTSFAMMLESYTNIRMKINNLLPVEYQGKNVYEKYPEDELETYVRLLITEHPKWKSRVTLVNSERAKGEYDAVVFL